jgi:ABC-type polysaccharide/polyol phosphate transport system ATPase subunit
MIKVEGISKKFKLYRSPADRLKEILFRRPFHKDFVALDNISFEINPGQTLGIIGQNGAGKSTLLKILSGIVIPDTGTISIDGKVTGLLELGTGFNPEMTGLENIYMNGTLIGMPREEIDQKKQTIIEFSELGEFIHEPIKTYSSGMTMRLAFSIAIHADPQCFLVDEALSVGDAYFQQKCMRKIQEFRDGGGSIVFVSHDMNAVLSISDFAIWLTHGKIQQMGNPRYVVDSYWSEIIDHMDLKPSTTNEKPASNPVKKSELPLSNIAPNVQGEVSRTTGELKCTSISIQNENGEDVSIIVSNETIVITVDYYALSDIKNPDYGILLRNQSGISVFGVNFVSNGLVEKIHVAKTIKRICYKIKMNLIPGDYFISLGVANNVQNGRECRFENYLLNIWDIKKITVIFNKDSPIYNGLTNLENSIEVLHCSAGSTNAQ